MHFIQIGHTQKHYCVHYGSREQVLRHERILIRKHYIVKGKTYNGVFENEKCTKQKQTMIKNVLPRHL